MATSGGPGLPPAAQAGSSSSPQEPVIRLHGYDVLMDVGTRPNTHVYKVRPKLHDDVPVYMDSEEPCYALKCIDLNDADLPAEGKQQAVRETQALLKLQHPNVARYHKAFLSDGRLCYMTEFAEQTLHHLIYTLKERQQRLSEDLAWHLFVQTCYGLKELHDSAIVHRALKARNLLLFEEPASHWDAHGTVISNGLMAAAPEHPLLHEFIGAVRPVPAVFASTGSHMLQQVLQINYQPE